MYQPSNMKSEWLTEQIHRSVHLRTTFLERATTNQNLKERTLANISHMTQSYCWNNFVIVRDNLKVKIRLDVILKQDVKLILSPNPTITFELTDVRFIGTFTILEC